MPRYVLGIAMQHDSGAAVLRDGEIIAAVNEERLNRQKLYWGVPELSIKEALRIAGIEPGQVDGVIFSNVFSGNTNASFEDSKKDFISRAVELMASSKLLRWPISTVPGIKISHLMLRLLPKSAGSFANCGKYLASLGITRKPVKFDHHTAHAYSSFLTSGWKDCMVITLDAVGDGYCSKIFVTDGRGSLKEIHRIPFIHSPGYYYAYVTHLCHFIPDRHEGKITGLAAYGNPAKTIDVFRNEIYYDSAKFSFINKGGYLWNEINKLKNKLKGATQEDMSAGIQLHLEELVTAYVRDAVKKTGIGKIAFAGGVFANVKLNQRIREIPGVEGVWIHPHMGDGGLAVGAALAHEAAAGIPLNKSIDNVYFGPMYDDAAVEKALRENGVVFKKYDNIENEIAKRLAEGKIVARFSGRMEYGPRALGNRSILYQATDPTVNDWLNKNLKRTEFMPFAPVILEEDAKSLMLDYDDKSSHASQFMTITYNVTEKCRKEAPAVVHVDGTARPQVIVPGVNPSYENILKEYKKLTGLSVLINTSFNMHEEPIVCTPNDAVRAFKLGHLKYLAIENYIAENS